MIVLQFSRQIAYINCIVAQTIEIMNCGCDDLRFETNPDNNLADKTPLSHAHNPKHWWNEINMMHKDSPFVLHWINIENVYSSATQQQLRYQYIPQPYPPPKTTSIYTLIG